MNPEKFDELKSQMYQMNYIYFKNLFLHEEEGDGMRLLYDAIYEKIIYSIQRAEQESRINYSELIEQLKHPFEP